MVEAAPGCSGWGHRWWCRHGPERGAQAGRWPRALWRRQRAARVGGHRAAGRCAGGGECHRHHERPRHRRGARQGRRRADVGALQGRRRGACRPGAGRDRCTQLPGCAVAGPGHAAARPGAAQECAARPQAVSGPAGARLHRQPAGGHPGRTGAPAGGYRGLRPGAGRCRAPATELHPGHRTLCGSAGPAPGGQGQRGGAERCQRHRHHQPGTAHRCRVLRARGAPAPDAPPHGRWRGTARGAVGPRQPPPAGQGPRGGAGQRHRQHHRHHQGQGRFCQ